MMSKEILTTTLFILFRISLFAQYNATSTYLIKKRDIEDGVLPIVLKDSNGNIKSFEICNDQLYAIITLDKNIPIIDFIPVPKKYDKDSADCICNKVLNKGGHFEIDLTKRRFGRMTRYVELPYHDYTFGVGLMPFKYRFKGDSISSTVTSNLGLCLSVGQTSGYSIIKNSSITNVGFTIGPFLGITSVDLNKNSVKSPLNWEKDITNLAISYGLNTIMSRNKLGLLISVGLDYNIGQFANSWNYQNKPWLGIGLCTNLGNY
jgi:hypothetical protein